MGVSFAVTAILLVLVSAFGAKARELTTPEKTIIEKSVTKDFKDPDAAKFKWPPIADKWSDPGTTTDGKPTGSLFYCGMVNGKNSFGAYTGYTPFLTMLFGVEGQVKVAALVGVGSPNDSGEAATYKMCKEKGLDPDSNE